jgi:hypothetical protein
MGRRVIRYNDRSIKSNLLCTNDKLKILHILLVGQQERKGMCRWNIFQLPSCAVRDCLYTANNIGCFNTETFIYTNKIFVEKPNRLQIEDWISLNYYTCVSCDVHTRELKLGNIAFLL